MLRFSGVILLCLAVAGTGFAMCERMRYRKLYLDKIERFAGLCSEEMRCSSDSIFEIFGKYAVKELSFLKEFNKDNIKDTDKIRAILMSHGIDERDMFTISDFIVRLGSGDIKSEEEHCAFFENKFAKMRCDAERELSDRGKLLKSLFMFAGAALFIILT